MVLAYGYRELERASLLYLQQEKGLINGKFVTLFGTHLRADKKTNPNLRRQLLREKWDRSCCLPGAGTASKKKLDHFHSLKVFHLNAY